MRERRANGLRRPPERRRRHRPRSQPTGHSSRPPRGAVAAGRASSRCGGVGGGLRPELDVHGPAVGRRDRPPRPAPVRDRRRAGRAAVRPVAAWRAFAAGMSPGRDVAELNANLRALGYGHELAGDAFTAATAAAIDAFQSGARRQPDRPASARLGRLRARAGAGDGCHPDRRCDRAARARAGRHRPRAGRSRSSSTPPSRAERQGRRPGHDHAARQPDDAGAGLLRRDGASHRPAPVTRERRLEHAHDRGRRDADRPGRDRAPRPGAGQRLDHDRERRRTRSSSRSTRCSRSRAAATRSRRSEPPAAHHLVAVSVGLFDDADGLVQVSGSGLAAGQRVVVPGE